MGGLSLKFNIKTGYNKGFEWHKKEDIYFIGYCFDNENNYLTGTDALDYILNATNSISYNKFLVNLNGVFSVIIRQNESVFLFSDKTRFFTLFYSQINNDLYISDDFYYLIKIQPDKNFNHQSITQFKSGAFVSGSDTIISNINQVRPAEIVYISEKGLEKKYLSTFSVKEENILKHDLPQLEEKAFEVFENAGSRLAKSLENKKVVLPLSGGYDSRLIACWLKMNNIKNVTCFTYGRKDTPDIVISEQVAKKLKYDWHYVEYNKDIIGDYFNSDGFNEYYKYASRGTSMFYKQEYFAMRELKDKGILDDNFIALPGHSGDFLGGSQLYKVAPFKKHINHPENILFKKSFWHENISSKEKSTIKSIIINQLKEIKETFNSNLDYSIMEDWLIKERIIKYVFNSSNIFTFFGGEVRFPFWDNELYNFWKAVPGEYRLYKNLYDKVLFEKYFKPLGVGFGENLQPGVKELALQKIKAQIKQYLPTAIKDKYRKKNDWVLYDEITQPMLNDLIKANANINDNGLSYLHRILNWYLLKVEREFFVT